ncbi:MAG: twin-arginine translocase TatA/TatE family subunit [Nitrospinaceae bacterium]
MMGIGFPELMIILVIIMIIFGAGKLPEIGSAFGRSIKNFKTSMREAEEEGKNAEGPELAPAEEGAEPKAVPETADSATAPEPAPDTASSAPPAETK